MSSKFTRDVDDYISPNRCNTKGRLNHHTGKDSANAFPCIFLPAEATAWELVPRPLLLVDVLRMEESVVILDSPHSSTDLTRLGVHDLLKFNLILCLF